MKGSKVPHYACRRAWPTPFVIPILGGIFLRRSANVQLPKLSPLGGWRCLAVLALTLEGPSQNRGDKCLVLTYYGSPTRNSQPETRNS